MVLADIFVHFLEYHVCNLNAAAAGAVQLFSPLLPYHYGFLVIFTHSSQMFMLAALLLFAEMQVVYWILLFL